MVTRRRRQPEDRITLSDVARAAGVSSITVSRVLRDPEKVSPQLRAQILAIIEDMGYVPHFAARALASHHSGVIAVLVPSLSNYVFLSAMRGIEDRARSTDLRIQYANTHFDAAEEIRQLKLFLGQNPAGLIVIGVEEHEEVRRLLQKARCPVVQMMDISTPPVRLGIGIDHYAAAGRATRHLIERGYRRIAMLGGTRDVRSARRQQSYREVLEAEGLFDPQLILPALTHTSIGLGCQMLETLLAIAPDADAAFCQNDDIALGVLFECQRRGISVPERFGIVGFNDLDYARASFPAITSVRLPRYEIGFQAVDMVIKAMNGATMPAHVVDLGFSLMERETTARGSVS